MATTSNMTTIKAALAYAHDELHNKRALSEADFDEKGLSTQAHEQWVAYVEELREVVCEYNKVAQGKDSTDKAIQTALGKVWSAWRAVLKEGTEGDFNANFFVRKADATMIANFAGLKAMDTARGKQFTNYGKADFRRNIETVIGIRMAGNAVLSDDDRDLVEAYEGAVKTIKRTTDALEGTTDKKGNPIPGLKTLETIAENNIKREEGFCDKYKVSKEEREDRLASLKKKLKDAQDAVKEAEKSKKAAEKTKEEKEEAYNAVIALLQSVGDFK